MSRKKKKETSSTGVYVLCITVGVIVGLGLTPLMGNFLGMIAIGVIAGVTTAFLINKNARNPSQKRHQ